MFCAIKRVQRYDKKCKMQNAECKFSQKSTNSLLKEREENAFPLPIFRCSLLFFTCDKTLHLAKYLLLGIPKRYALEVAHSPVIVGFTLFEVC